MFEKQIIETTGGFVFFFFKSRLYTRVYTPNYYYTGRVLSAHLDKAPPSLISCTPVFIIILIFESIFYSYVLRNVHLRIKRFTFSPQQMPLLLLLLPFNCNYPFLTLSFLWLRVHHLSSCINVHVFRIIRDNISLCRHLCITAVL